jgi:isopropylmalate/homocitrate/citramalate synthase
VQEAAQVQHQLALSARERGDRELGDVQAQLAQATANHSRVQMLLADSESQQMQVVAERAAERMRDERALGHAILERTQILKALADLRVELQAGADSARALETLAAAGRLTRDVGREFEGLLNDFTAGAKHLLDLAPLEAPYRRDVETLVAVTERARSLARQFRCVDTSSESEESREAL